MRLRRQEGCLVLPVAVLVSGSGSNLQALLDASAADPEFGARIAVVISDRPGVGALQRALQSGVPAEVVRWGEFNDRESFSVAICDTAERYGAEALILAGFMRILSPAAIDRYPNRIINIHPALLPAFPGAHAVPAALAHGVKVSGVTVHFVDDEVDHGPIIAQQAVPVQSDDTEETLHARIQKEEHLLFPLVIKAFSAGSLRVVGRHVIWEES
ncbi:MAG: phosphoribosylglycinamide formyltransferase [Acidimicrobiia bacterium]|nr:phosphoribosylglycinamide formyltransferase [Acidimicrobiia bacterium]MDH3396859.1 phosphoribosylglycinamide formyltransferase [Acidimicrobiia bacterium]MDH5616344.1 phosphoribosylglycinamide formyltransferase [Acidimicrobiia bacterium]